MRALTALTVVSLLAVVLAGCASESSTPAAPPPSTSAPAPAPTIEKGSLTGLVTDDEQLPVAGVGLTLIPGPGTAKTDAAGAFTINDIEPGEHVLHAQALGYESAARKISIVAGEATEVTLALAPIPIAEEVYVHIIPAVFYIQFGWWGSAEWVQVLQPALCNPCEVYRTITPKPSAGQLEMDWTKSVPLPNVADTSAVYVYARPRNATTSVWTEGDRAGGGAGPPRTAIAFTEAHVSVLKNADLVMLRAFSPYNNQVTIQQRINAWISLAYNGEMPEEHTALPPK